MAYRLRTANALRALDQALVHLEAVVEDAQDGPLNGVLDHDQMNQLEAKVQRLRELCGEIVEDDPMGDHHGRNV